MTCYKECLNFCHFCLELFSGAISFSGAYFGAGNENMKVFFTNVSCTGHENQLLACQYDTPSTCLHSSDAGIRCLPGPGVCMFILQAIDCVIK